MPHSSSSFLVLLAVACIDTGLAEPSGALPCSTATTVDATAQSVVRVTADLGERGQRYCSGVVIAPRLVLTSFTCVAFPADADAEELRLDDTPRIRDHFDPVFSCDAQSGWTPIEDGAFAARFGGVLSEEALSVGEIGAGSAIAPVEEIVVAALNSRCAEGLALLIVRDSLPLLPVPLRLLELEQVGERTLMSSVQGNRGRLSRELRIEAVTDYRGTADTPPNSLRLAPSACPYELGAGILSSESGALIAIVSENNERCGGTDDSTQATRVVHFREMLLESSKPYGQTLVAEHHPASRGLIPVCP